MSFEAIPEDRCESYPCPICGKGNVIITSQKPGEVTIWECDTCEFTGERQENE